jgi:hypothetical protein
MEIQSERNVVIDMSIYKIFIVVPSSVYESPIKGAVALANALSKWVSVTFITLKQGDNSFDLLDDSVEWVSLAKYNWHEKLKILRGLIKKSRNKGAVATISSSFSADFVNSLCVNNASITCASVRGNLPVAYVNSYGFMGKWIAYFHLNRLKKIDQVVSMTVGMSKQVQKNIGKKSPIIGNFINEKSLASCRRKQLNNGMYRLIFTGSLAYGKQPMILIDAVATLIGKGKDIGLDIFGYGPLFEILKNRIIQLGIDDKVILHGYVKNLYLYVARADVLVLPSLSEGVSRSALEALYLGIPCVLRDIDGASELIQDGVNGYLFKDNSELVDVIIRAIELSRSFSECSILLPEEFRQQNAAKKYLELLECGMKWTPSQG